MAYTPTEWKDMDIITAEKLNKIEAQLTPLVGTMTVELDGNGDPVLDANDNEIYNCDLSYKDIHDAYFAGRNVILYLSNNTLDNSSGITIVSKMPFFVFGFEETHKNEKKLYSIIGLLDGRMTGLQSTSETEPMTSEERGPEYFEDPTQQ